MKVELDNVLKQAKEEISDVKNSYDLNMFKSRHLGKKSFLMSCLKQLNQLPGEEKPHAGKQINLVKKAIEEIIANQELRLKKEEAERIQRSSQVDVTMPGYRIGLGYLHPLTKIQREIENIFISMGFDIAEGPDIEDEFHNFDALNTPPDHPARNLADTFYLDPECVQDREDILLRTQTSTVQIRVMEQFKPPLKVISPGKCYRNDKPDATHLPSFHQVEGLVIGEDINFSDLHSTLDLFMKKFFGPDIESRFRPHFFPFTEPSAEVDITCFNCKGKGCSICKNSGWIEIAGAGMVDPNVFKVVNIDPEKYIGFAFGMGIDRIAMLRYSLPDIRFLFENDVRFLK